MFRDIWLIVALLGGLAGPMPSAVAQQQTTLAELGRTLNIDFQKISVSGISSGGFMAHQFHVAHSTNLMGVGIVAGGPYHCAQGDVIRGIQTCTAFAADGCRDLFAFGNPPLEALCVADYNGPGPAPRVAQQSHAAMEMAQQSVEYTFQDNLDIDDPHGIVDDRVIILHGKNDRLLPIGVSDALNQYYRKVYKRLNASEDTLRYLTSLPANHSMPMDNKIGLKVGAEIDNVNVHVRPCTTFGPPYVNACSRDDCAGSCCQDASAAICGDPANAENPRCRTCDATCTSSLSDLHDNPLILLNLRFFSQQK